MFDENDETEDLEECLRQSHLRGMYGDCNWMTTPLRTKEISYMEKRKQEQELLAMLNKITANSYSFEARNPVVVNIQATPLRPVPAQPKKIIGEIELYEPNTILIDELKKVEGEEVK